jgi:hypothetical protein
MTSQRDETTHHTAGEEMADDPIIIERRDEILTGDSPAGGMRYDPAPDEDATASDELVGRHAAPDTGGMDPAPLVVPPEIPRPDTGSMETGRPGLGRGEADAPEAGVPVGMPGASASSAATPGAADPGPAAPGSAPSGSASPDPAAGATGGTIPAAALSEQQWPAIQSMFVDDPKGSVQRAAAAADEVVKALVASIEREQAALNTAWENDASTEDLRTALQQYRAFCGRLEGLA